jgi:hypothetical protein
MKEYNVDSKIKKLSRPEIWIILLIILGLIRYLFNAIRNTYSFEEPFKFLDFFAIPSIGIGILLLWNIKLSIKKIRGSYLKLDTESFSFKSRGIEKEFNSLSEIKAIDISIETVSITDNSSKQFVIFLDDYLNDGEQLEIKEYFKEIKEKIENDN